MRKNQFLLILFFAHIHEMNCLKIQYKISKKFTKYKIYDIINMMNVAAGSSSRKKIIIIISERRTKNERFLQNC